MGTRAVQMLLQKGLPDVREMKGGLTEWEKAGYPVEEGPPTLTPRGTSGPPQTPEPTTTSALTPLNPLRVHFIDVGQGDSILIDLAETEVLIDGGGEAPGVVPYLQDYVDGPIEALVATNPRTDHIGGLAAVLNAYKVDQVWHNGEKADSEAYSAFLAAAQSEGAAINLARLGDRIHAGALDLVVINPSTLAGTTANNSIVLSLRYGQIDLLFAGDAQKAAEGAMLVQSVAPVPEAEILKVGHHGSSLASSPAFIAATKPKVAIYTAAKGNSYGYPNAETVANLEAVGALVYGTDANGTVVVWTDGVDYEVNPARQNGSPEPASSGPTPSPKANPQASPTPLPGTLPPQANAEAPPVRAYRVVASYPHDPWAFTQGLAIDDHILYEGTGLLGQSTLRMVDLQTGKVTKTRRLPDRLFGEGIAIYGDRIVQLTWQSNLGLVHDKDTFQVLQEFSYPTEGWGITHDGSQWIMSDGTAALHFLDTETFSEVRRIEAFDNNGPVAGLNELEYIQGEIYANIWPTDRIAIIAPRTGQVTGWIELDGLLGAEYRTSPVDVLNGIAYDAELGHLYVTGKWWPRLFQIELRPVQ